MTEPIDERQIARALDGVGLGYVRNLNPQIARQLGQWLTALLDEPRNLTAIRDPHEAIARHVIEPLQGRHRLIESDLPVPHGPMIDVGSGNGAPGLPFALCEPDREMTLLDSRAGAARFLNLVGPRIGADSVRVLQERAEAAARAELRGRFALALSRAAAPPTAALELAAPFLQVGGIAMLWTGELDDHSLEQLTRSAIELGAEPTPLDTPQDIAVFTQVRPVDERFPRRWNQIRRRPLPLGS